MNSSGAWRHPSMTRDLATDIDSHDSVFSPRTGATLPKGEYSVTIHSMNIKKMNRTLVSLKMMQNEQTSQVRGNQLSAVIPNYN